MKYIVNLNGKDYEVEVEKGKAIMVDVRDAVASAPVAAPVATAPAAAAPVAAAAAVSAAAGTKVEAPLPGVVAAIKVTEGQMVKEGDVLVVVEAMKMENDISAPCSGKVVQIAVQKGKQLTKGELLVVIG